ncbi:MAG: hypothetical protein MJ233_03795 [Mycoplasmoidaceae bacterium]|nr:hypothetical protein [Mycoplasmoidaceae bacterium]
MTIKIPAANFTSKKREIEFYLDLEPCTLNDSLVLDQYSKEYYDVGGTKYNAIHSTGAGTPLVKNTSVEFEVDLNK